MIVLTVQYTYDGGHNVQNVYYRSKKFIIGKTGIAHSAIDNQPLICFEQLQVNKFMHIICIFSVTYHP